MCITKTFTFRSHDNPLLCITGFFSSLLAKKKTKMDELDARACDLRAEVARATQDGAALREDASAAAARASEARRSLASAEHDTARLASQAETLRATKDALDSELAGLRHELDTLRRRGDGDGGGTMATGGGGGGGLGWKEKRGEGDHLLLPAEASSTRGAAAMLSREGCVRGGGGSHGARETPPPPTTGRPARSTATRASEDGAGGGGCRTDGGNLVEIVAEFQGRLRRQVQAALADGGGVGTCSADVGDDDGRIRRGSTSAAVARSSSFSQVTTVGLVDDGDAPPRARLRRQTPADSRGASLITHWRLKDGPFSGRVAGGRGGGDVLGELEKRIGSV